MGGSFASASRGDLMALSLKCKIEPCDFGSVPWDDSLHLPFGATPPSVVRNDGCGGPT